MPTYQYACTDCGHRLEKVQSFSDASLTECPECSGTLRKLFGSVGVVFKGSGFYRTDSRAEAKSGKPSSGSDSSSTSSSSSDSSSKSSGKSGDSSSTPAKPSSPSSGSSSGGSSSGNSSSGATKAAP